MRNTLVTAITATALVALAGPAAAQDNSILKPARMEVGANFTVLSGELTNVTGGPQFAFTFKPRHAVQVSADLNMERGSSWWDAGTIYIVQYRYTLPIRSTKTQVFLTAGGAGYLGWHHYDAYSYTTGGYSYVSNGQTVTVPVSTYHSPAQTNFEGFPPVIPTGGIGFQHAINNRIAVRGDVTAIPGLGWWLGVRASGGIVIPIGQVKR